MNTEVLSITPETHTLEYLAWYKETLYIVKIVGFAGDMGYHDIFLSHN